MSLVERYDKNEFSIGYYNYVIDNIISESEGIYMYHKVNKLVIKYDNYLYKMLIEGEENPLLFYYITYMT